MQSDLGLSLSNHAGFGNHIPEDVFDGLLVGDDVALDWAFCLLGYGGDRPQNVVVLPLPVSPAIRNAPCWSANSSRNSSGKSDVVQCRGRVAGIWRSTNCFASPFPDKPMRRDGTSTVDGCVVVCRRREVAHIEGVIEVSPRPRVRS